MPTACHVCSRCGEPWTSGLSRTYRTCPRCRKADAVRRERRKRVRRGDGIHRCTSCLRPWNSTLFRTCNVCRENTAKAKKRQRDSGLFRVSAARTNGSSVCSNCQRPWHSDLYIICDECRHNIALRRAGQTVTSVDTNIANRRINRPDRNSRPSVTSIPTETRSSTASPSPAPNVPARRPKANRRARATRMWWSRVACLKVRPFSQS